MEGHPGDVEGTPADLLLPGDSCPSLAWLFPLGLRGTCAGTTIIADWVLIVCKAAPPGLEAS